MTLTTRECRLKAYPQSTLLTTSKVLKVLIQLTDNFPVDVDPSKISRILIRLIESVSRGKKGSCFPLTLITRNDIWELIHKEVYWLPRRWKAKLNDRDSSIIRNDNWRKIYNMTYSSAKKWAQPKPCLQIFLDLSTL